MVRLNRAMRDEVIRNLQRKKYVEYEAKELKMQEEINALKKVCAKGAYEAVYSPKTRKLMADAPEGHYPTAKEVRVRKVDPKDDENYEDTRISFDDLKRIPYKHYTGATFAAVINADNPVFTKLSELTAKTKEMDEFRQTFREERNASYHRVNNILNSVTTVKRLLEIWPQVQEYLPELVSASGGGVPAHLIEDLNREYGL